MLTTLGERLFPGGTVLSKLGILLAIAVCMTLIEYIGGILCLIFLALHTQRPIGEWLKELYPEDRMHGRRAKR